MAGRGRRYGLGSAGGLAIIAAAVAGLHVFQAFKEPAVTPTITGRSAASCTSDGQIMTCSAPADSSPRPKRGATTFRDGSFAAQGHYLTPGGDEAITVRLTIADNRVVRSQVQVEAISPTAQQFQRQFVSRYASHVVAGELESLNLTRIAGASLTSLGFDNAVKQIQDTARA